MIEVLKPILEKDPIISTYSAIELFKSPEVVEEYYLKVARTHMSIGDTKEYQNRIINCLSKNATTFNGAVVGEYGFGKTSIMIYLWNICNDNKILALPPYQWTKFDEHFKVIYSWTKYKIRKYGPDIQNKLDEIYSRYKDPTVETKAGIWAKGKGIDYNKAVEIVNEEYLIGNLSLDFSADDLINYCEEVSNFLLKETEYTALLVMTDELQQTMAELNPKIVYDYLFNIANPLCNRKGNFGFFWGFPEKTFANIMHERSDIIDRLNSNKSFIRLGNVYNTNFPLFLWDSYATNFEFEEIKYKVVDKSTLKAIGQVCDSSRRDLGNGPRSVISAFNAMVNHYENTKQSYGVIDFVNNCLDGEITLGGKSDFNNRVQSVLNIDKIGVKFENIIKILAGFPAGIPQDSIDEYGIRDELELLIKETGGLGKVVVRPINSFLLKSLIQHPEEYKDSIIEDEIRKLYGEFSFDNEFQKIILTTFNKLLTESVFIKQTKGSFKSWKITDQWNKYRDGYRCILEGSFSDKYPLRKISIFTTISKTDENYELIYSDIPKEHLSFNFILYPNLSDDFQYVVSEIGKNTFKINLDLSYAEDALKNLRINEIVPVEKQTPFFFLALIDHLDNCNIPKNELPETEHLISKLKENVIYNLFNDELLGSVQNSEIELNNEGEYLIRDLFIAACEKTFKKYKTILKSTIWDKKIGSLINVLNQDSEIISLLQKRGKEKIQLSVDNRENKEKISQLFGQKKTNFEAWLTDLDDLLSYNFSTDENYLLLKIHPLEKYILRQIENEGKERIINDSLCKTLKLTPEFLSELFNLGYLENEILKIIEIGVARKYFKFLGDQKLIYIKPEDKDELRDQLQNFCDIVFEQVKNLECFDDFPDCQVQIKEIRGKIPLVENKEQDDAINKELKQIQSNNKHFCIKKIQNILQVEIPNYKRIIENKSNELNKLFKDKISEPATGIASWVKILEKIRINIENEVHNITKESKNILDRLQKCVPPNVPTSKKVIDLFISVNNEYKCLSDEIEKKLIVDIERTETKINDFLKWKIILKKAGDVESLIQRYSNFDFINNFKITVEDLSNRIHKNLEINEKVTLENNEKYLTEFKEIDNNLKSNIIDLRKVWEAKKQKFEEKIGKFTGHKTNLKTRWSESPEVSYQDLYEFVVNEIEFFLNKTYAKYIELDDDVTYSIEVLNHGKAIKNREIDIKLRRDISELENLLRQQLINEIKSEEKFDELVNILVNINGSYSSIYKDHLQIIKPIPIEDDAEKNFFSLLDKNNNSDLKRLIIEYKKNCEPNIDLTQSRDKILDILKELFLKKQVSIFVKKGKN